MDSRTDRSNAQRPLLLGALTLAILFAAAGGAVWCVGGARAAEACRRDAVARAQDAREGAARVNAADRAAAMQAKFDQARVWGEAIAREAARPPARTGPPAGGPSATDVASDPDAAKAAATTTGSEFLPSFLPLPGRAESWNEFAAPGTFALTRETGDAERRALTAWAQRLGPILGMIVGDTSAIGEASVVFGGLGAIGAPAAWPADAGSNPQVASLLTHDLDDWSSTAVAGWDFSALDPTYETPIVGADGSRTGVVRVRLSHAAVTALLTVKDGNASARAALVTETGAIAASLGIDDASDDKSVRAALRAAVPIAAPIAVPTSVPSVGGSAPTATYVQSGRHRFGVARVPGAPCAVAVVVPDAPLAIVDPPSAVVARELGFATFALAVTLGLTTILGAVLAASRHAKRIRPVLRAIYAHEAGDYSVPVDVAGDDDTADVARWMNTAALRLRIAGTRAEESDRRIANLIGATADGFVTTDANDRITQVNARFAELLHVPEKSLVGRVIEELLLPESVERWRNHRRRQPEGRPARFELAWQGGRRAHPRTLVSCVPLLNDDGSTAGRYVVVTDMTDRVRVHEEIARAEKVRALGEMAGGVAHDFNNVLTVILGNTQFLLLEDHPSDVQQTLKVVERAAIDGTETVRRIREFAKPRALPVNAALVSPNDVVGAVMDRARERFKAEGIARGVEFNVRVECRSCRKLRGNAAELREALSNVVDNALDAMPRGGSLAVEAFDRGEDAIAIRIEDTGVGMTAEQATKVFDPFYTTKQGGRCPGLGLSIAFGIVRAHRGQIDLRSSPGQGATFTIVLPAAAVAPAADEAEPITGGVPARVDPRVLLVGGEVGGMQPFLDEMRSLGVYVTSVHPAAAQPLIAESGIFNTLVVDFELGATSGWEMARQARARREDLRIVLLTTPANPVSETQAKNAGIDRVLVRPFDARDLHAEVFGLLASPRERTEAPAPASVRNRAAPSIRLRDTSADSSQTSEVWSPGAVRPAPIPARTRTTSETGDDAPASESASASASTTATIAVDAAVAAAVAAAVDAAVAAAVAVADHAVEEAPSEAAPETSADPTSRRETS
ncbi:MAG: PAS domain-containing protein [Planctomycetes bacterium]|nr:PAS domain-containing protein [Planctomycetota bacterium]